jgi:hypothetical protein
LVGVCLQRSVDNIGDSVESAFALESRKNGVSVGVCAGHGSDSSSSEVFKCSGCPCVFSSEADLKRHNAVFPQRSHLRLFHKFHKRLENRAFGLYGGADRSVVEISNIVRGQAVLCTDGLACDSVDSRGRCLCFRKVRGYFLNKCPRYEKKGFVRHES